jgi:hypothetical protein
MMFLLNWNFRLQLYLYAKRYVRRLLVSIPNRRFKFDKHGKLFIRAHNETLPIAAVRVGNPGWNQLISHR